MDSVNLTIDGRPVRVPAGTTVLEAARSIGIYIPTLCYHPDLPPAKGAQAAGVVYQGERALKNAMPETPDSGCGLCVVEIGGDQELVGACATQVQTAMQVTTANDRIQATRQAKLALIMSRHRHTCLTCAQQQGCPQTHCSSDVPEAERCCARFGHCELQNVANYVGLLDSTPRWIPTDLTVIDDQPLFARDYNLCIGCTRCVRACRDLRGIEALGFVYDDRGQVQVGTLAETLEAAGCKFCTACVAVCPTGALADKPVESATREADFVPCKAACPAHIDVPGYLRLIAQGRADQANAVIREKVPFPGVLGRVCLHPCESVCRRGEVDEPIAICALKRYAADGQKGLRQQKTRVAGATGKTVAVIGAGPAGLTAAFYLRQQGHAVSLFESGNQAGGMLRWGIPAYRLPRPVLDNEIADVLDLGIDFRPHQSLGRDFSLEQLKKDGFNAVFLSVGAGLDRRIAFEDCHPPDTLWGAEFLRRVAESEDVRLKDRVVVIGGGNVAVDAARTALRCGATDVKMACLEGRDEMPASPWEIEAARAEGIQILPSRGPGKIVRQGGQIIGMDLAACSVAFDDQGNFCPEFSDETECIRVDQVILAVGQAADLSFLEDRGPIRVEGGLIVVNEQTLETGMPGVYAGGDIAGGTGDVIHAVAAGRRAAESIDRALGGDGDIEEVLFERGDPGPHLGRDEGFVSRRRVVMPELDVETRVNGFQEIALGYRDDQAFREAKRCLQCDLRLQIGCNPDPPQAWQPFDVAHVKTVPESEGVFQLLDAANRVLAIQGTANLRRDLLTALDGNEQAVRFEFAEDKMFSRRESELIQKYLQTHGEMPGGGADELDDLF